MKLLRFGTAGQERPGALDTQGRVRDLSGVVADIDGATLSDEALAKLRAVDLDTLPLAPADIRYGPCVGKVGKFLCIGLNYADHAAESGLPIPEEPVLFTKATSAIVGPNDTVLKPRGSTKLDWEVELGVVIGKTASYVEEADAEAHIAGYCVINDVSERAFQLERGGQWAKGKSAETFNPAGPWLATADEIEDVLALDMWLDVNGQRRQTGNTKTMIFDPYVIVHYLSQFLTLEPGDLINTGTPPGVGMGLTPPVYLKPGDTVELGITGLGTQRQHVIAPR